MQLNPITAPTLTVLARVIWPIAHPSQNCMGKPVQIWCSSLFESSNKNAFIPIENIRSLLLTTEVTLNNENVRVMVPVV